MKTGETGEIGEVYLRQIQSVVDAYSRRINNIDDYLEYRYKTHNKEQIRRHILEQLSALTNDLEKIMKDHKETLN